MKPLVIVFLDADSSNLSWKSFNQNVLISLSADLAVLSLDGSRDMSDCEFWTNAKIKWKMSQKGDLTHISENCSVIFDGDGEQLNWEHIKPFFNRFISDESIYNKEFLFENIELLSLRDRYSSFVITSARYIWQAPHPPLDLLEPDECWLHANPKYPEMQHVVIHNNDLLVYLSTLRVATLKYRYWKELQLLTSQIDLIQMTFSSYLKHCFSAFSVEKRVLKFPSIMFSIHPEKDEKNSLKKQLFLNKKKFQINPYEFFLSEYFAKLISFPRAWNFFYSKTLKDEVRIEPTFLLMDRCYQTLDLNLNINQVHKLVYNDSDESTLADIQNKCHLMVRFEGEEAIIFDSTDNDRKNIYKAMQYTNSSGRDIWRLSNGNISCIGLDANGRFCNDELKIIVPPLIVETLTFTPIIY